MFLCMLVKRRMVVGSDTKGTFDGKLMRGKVSEAFVPSRTEFFLEGTCFVGVGVAAMFPKHDIAILRGYLGLMARRGFGVQLCVCPLKCVRKGPGTAWRWALGGRLQYGGIRCLRSACRIFGPAVERWKALARRGHCQAESRAAECRRGPGERRGRAAIKTDSPRGQSSSESSNDSLPPASKDRQDPAVPLGVCSRRLARSAACH
jgi:hypothetical protein